jgi:hypothetical protein
MMQAPAPPAQRPLIVPAALAAGLNPPERIADALLRHRLDTAADEALRWPGLEWAIVWLLFLQARNALGRALGLHATDPLGRLFLHTLPWGIALLAAATLASVAHAALPWLAAWLALTGTGAPGADRLAMACAPGDPIVIPPDSPAAPWVRSGLEALGLEFVPTRSGLTPSPASIAASLRERIPPAPVTALDHGLALLALEAAARIDAGERRQDDLAVAAAVIAPDPPAPLWGEALTLALHRADPAAVRRDLAIINRAQGAADRITAGAALLARRSRRDMALLLSAHRRLVARELLRGSPDRRDPIP